MKVNKDWSGKQAALNACNIVSIDLKFAI